MMNHRAWFPVAVLMLVLPMSLIGQPNPWKYLGKIRFPPADSIAARPYLCTVNQNGRLYVISSSVTDANAHNAVYYANPGDSVFTKWIDYTLNGDSDTLTGNIGRLRGIVALGNDLIVIASQPYPKTKPNTLAAAYYYTNADTNNVQRFGFGIGGSGYGSFIQGGDISSDSMLIAGIDFGTTFRWYNWGRRYKKSAWGSWNPPDTTNLTIFSNATEPGGPQTSGLDLIRDVALIPGGNYYDKNTVFYTSRNSVSNTQQTGGIAVWKGGTQVQPINYTPSRITDFDFFLSFGDSWPCGITADSKGVLWVAGIDSTRRWVKGFDVQGVNAVPLYDLPSQTSGDIQDPGGAPMSGPCDVALDRTEKFAYVVDLYARCVFRFRNSTVDVREDPVEVSDFRLKQNYPNPFNPTTTISFSLNRGGRVQLKVIDLLGRDIQTLVDGALGAGTHAAVFTADRLPSGVYVCVLSSGGARRAMKMILMK